MGLEREKQKGAEGSELDRLSDFHFPPGEEKAGAEGFLPSTHPFSPCNPADQGSPGCWDDVTTEAQQPSPVPHGLLPSFTLGSSWH